MTVGDLGAIGSIIAGIIAVIGALWVIFSFYNKVGRIDSSVKALLLIHTKELIEFYRRNISSSNPGLSPETNALLDKLEKGTIDTQEIKNLKKILEEEKAEAKRKNQQRDILAINALLLIIYLYSNNKQK